MSARDPGLQPERTALAWGRTALSLALNAILFLRSGLQEQHFGLLATGVSLCAGAAVVARMSTRRRTELRDGFRAPPPWLMPLVAGLAAAAGLVAVVALTAGMGFDIR